MLKSGRILESAPEMACNEESNSESESEVMTDEEVDDQQEEEEAPTKLPENNVPEKFDEENQLMDLLFGNKDQLIERMKDGTTPSKPTTAVEKRKAVWRDSDDEDVKVDEGMQRSRVRTYLQDPDRQYKQHLTKKFQKIVGEPKWAQLDRGSSDSDDSDNEALKRVGHVLAPSQGALMRNTLDYRRRRDLNKTTSSEGPRINSVEFHPNSCVAMVGGASGIASIFSVESKNCDKLHSVFYKKYPIMCARFSKGGEEAIFGGQKNFIHTFDLIAGQSHKTMLPRNTMTKMSQFEVSPDGNTIAVIGRFGEIHLLQGKTKEWMGSLKQEHLCSALTFSTNSGQLFTHSTDNEVNVFDLRQQRTSHRFTDDGCISGRTISISPNGRLLATGSAEGIVNVYDADQVLLAKFPQPIKVISNLATGLTMTRFNATSEILGLCSSDTMDGVKLAHFPSGSVFANFPVTTRSFGHPTCVAFSPGGRYMALGTINFRAPLFELKHFGYF